MNSLFARLVAEKHFTASERKIADLLLKNPQWFLDATTANIGNKTQTSSAAVVRFAKKLGYAGFPALRLDIALATTDNKQPSLSEITADESVDDILAKTSARFKLIPDTIAQQNNASDFLTATQLIEQAQHIFIYGIAASSLVAQDLQQKFTRIGIEVIYHADFHQMITSIQAIATDNDISIIISESGNTYETLKFQKISLDLNLKTIVITSNPDTPLSTNSHVILQTATQQFDKVRFASTIGLLSQLYVIDILFYTYISRHYNAAQEKIALTRARIDQDL